jgi:hypothetical protein
MLPLPQSASKRICAPAGAVAHNASAINTLANEIEIFGKILIIEIPLLPYSLDNRSVTVNWRAVPSSVSYLNHSIQSKTESNGQTVFSPSAGVYYRQTFFALAHCGSYFGLLIFAIGSELDW